MYTDKLIDHRDNKVYEGKLSNTIQIGKRVEFLLVDGQHYFDIVRVRRYMRLGKKHYIIDGDGLKFTLITD